MGIFWNCLMLNILEIKGNEVNNIFMFPPMRLYI